MGFAYVGASMPVYWLGLVFILSSPSSRMVSAGRRGRLASARAAGDDAWPRLGRADRRLIRSSMIEVLSEDYIRTAGPRASRAPRPVAHGLKNALIPVVTMVGLQFGGMLAGAVVTETVFSRPGIGACVSAILPRIIRWCRAASSSLRRSTLLVNLAGRHRLCVARSAHPVYELTAGDGNHVQPANSQAAASSSSRPLA